MDLYPLQKNMTLSISHTDVKINILLKYEYALNLYFILIRKLTCFNNCNNTV